VCCSALRATRLRDAYASCLSDTAKPDDPQDVDSNDGDNASDGAPEDEHEAEEEGLVPAEAPASGPKAGKVVEPDRQLSKKELKKKELDDMDAILAELGIQVAPTTNGGAAGAEAGLSKTAQRKLKKQQQVRLLGAPNWGLTGCADTLLLTHCVAGVSTGQCCSRRR
jgi:hypothetical protein